MGHLVYPNFPLVVEPLLTSLSAREIFANILLVITLDVCILFSGDWMCTNFPPVVGNYANFPLWVEQLSSGAEMCANFLLVLRRMQSA